MTKKGKSNILGQFYPGGKNSRASGTMGAMLRESFLGGEGGTFGSGLDVCTYFMRLVLSLEPSLGGFWVWVDVGSLID